MKTSLLFCAWMSLAAGLALINPSKAFAREIQCKIISYTMNAGVQVLGNSAIVDVSGKTDLSYGPPLNFRIVLQSENSVGPELVRLYTASLDHSNSLMDQSADFAAHNYDLRLQANANSWVQISCKP